MEQNLGIPPLTFIDTPEINSEIEPAIVTTNNVIEGVNDNIDPIANDMAIESLIDNNTANNMSLSNMAYVSFLWRNDLHWLHHHIAGPQFDELHELFGEYYEKSLEEFDFFSEKSIAVGDKIINLSKVASSDIYNSWNILESDGIVNIDVANAMLQANGSDYIEALQMCRQYIDGATDIESRIDEFLDYWTTEIQYKANQRNKKG
jgi:DNA-binding ferritin-like protein